MAQLSKNAFLAKYNDAISGLFKAGQTAGIGSDDHRSLVQDIFDSLPFLTDANDFSVPFTRLFISSGATNWDWVNGYFSLALVEASADFDLNFTNQVLGSQGTIFIKKTVAGDVVVTIPTHQQVGAAGTTTTITLSGDDEQIFRVDFFKSETSSFNQVATTAQAFSKIQHLTATTVLGFEGQDIYQSTDGGLTWTVVYTTTDDEILDFSFNGANGVLLTRSLNGSNYDFFLYTSSDSGDTFSSYSVGGNFTNRNSGYCQKVVYYGAGDFYTSGEVGAPDFRPIINRVTSNNATPVIPTGEYSVSSFFEILSTDLWIVCTNQTSVQSKLLKRTGATTFSEVTSSPIGDNTIRSIAAATSSLVIAVGNDSAQDPIIAKSVDGGATFTEKTIDTNIGILRLVDAVSATSFIVVGDNGIGYSTDSGENWDYFSTPNGGDALSAWDSDDILIASSTSIFKGFGSTIGDIFQLHGSSSTGSGSLQSVKVTVSSAQILNSNSSPVQIIAAPGSGKFITILSNDVYYDYVTTAYATNVNVGLRYGSGTAIVASTQASAIINQTSDRFQKWLQENTLNVGSTSVYDNQGIFFTTFVGNPTAGDGTLTFYINYVIIDL